MPRPQGQQQRVLTLQNRQVKCQCTAYRPVDNNNNISSLRAEINKCYPPHTSYPTFTLPDLIIPRIRELALPCPEAQTIRITRSLCDVATYGLLLGFHLSLPPK